MGKFIRHEPCPKCGSKDALARYEDGSATCFSGSCGHWEPRTDSIRELPEIKDKPKKTVEGTPQALENRNIKEETCEIWSYTCGEDDKGRRCHIANYRDGDGTFTGQKLRYPGKQFSVVGKLAPLYGMWRFGKGKHLVITEGEIDALTVSQVFDNKYPVVSLPNGASSVEKSIKDAYEWLDGFDNIVLMFDMDAPGREAVEKAAAMLPIGRVKVASLPAKDANQTLLDFGPASITQAFWNASPWRPDGIVQVKDLREAVLNPPKVISVPYKIDALNAKLKGQRRGELVTWTGGSGLGKSTILREVLNGLLDDGESVGGLFLEESNVKTIEGIIGIRKNANIIVDRSLLTPQEISEGFDDLQSKPLYLYNHFGSNDIDQVVNKIRYLVKGCGCNWIFLDHISILVSGLETDNERKLIDMAMTKLRTLVSETGCGMHLVSHLTRPKGDTGHEEGASIHLGQLRGSHAIAQLSDAVVGIQVDPENPHSKTCELVVLKNRFTGDKGPAGTLTYDPLTGRMTESTF